MKKIGFIGAFDKANFITYIAKILQLLDYKVLVLDTTKVQKMRYIVPAINPTKSYITSFEEIDFGVGFEGWEEVEKYLGIKFDTNDEQQSSAEEKDDKSSYDYVLIDIDNGEKLKSFEMANAERNYFITAFDMFSLRKGISIFGGLENPLELTRILFSYESCSREDEEFLNFISLEYKIHWNDYTMYFRIYGADNKIFEDNQRVQKLRFKKLSQNYRDSLAYVVQDICKTENMGKIKRMMKE